MSKLFLKHHNVVPGYIEVSKKFYLQQHNQIENIDHPASEEPTFQVVWIQKIVQICLKNTWMPAMTNNVLFQDWIRTIG